MTTEESIKKLMLHLRRDFKVEVAICFMAFLVSFVLSFFGLVWLTFGLLFIGLFLGLAIADYFSIAHLQDLLRGEK